MMGTDFKHSKVVLTTSKNRIMLTGTINKNYTSFPGYSTWKSVMLDLFEYNICGSRKERLRIATEILGMSPTTFSKLLNAKLREVFIQPIVDASSEQFLLTTCCSYSPMLYTKAGLLVTSVHRYSQNIDTLAQLKEDDMLNVAPIIVRLHSIGVIQAATVECARAYLGKGVWKTICGNSLRHNTLISNSLSKHIGRNVDKQTYYKNVCKLRYSSVEKFVPYGVASEYLLMAEAALVKAGKLKRNFIDYVVILDDTERLAQQLGKPFNPKWSYSRMHEMHDKYKDDLMARRFSKEKFDNIASDIQMFEYEDGTAGMLTSPAEYAEEGNKMHHCIAGYASLASSGRYLAFHITTEDGESTLGIRVTDNGFVFNQHYSYHNSPAPTLNVEIATRIMSALNKKVEAAA